LPTIREAHNSNILREKNGTPDHVQFRSIRKLPSQTRAVRKEAVAKLFSTHVALEDFAGRERFCHFRARSSHAKFMQKTCLPTS
jgi:hypothetical protein